MTTDHSSRLEPAYGSGRASKPVLSVVIPVFNEGRQIEAHVGEVMQTLEGSSIGRDYEILLCDDGSADDTWDAIEALSGRLRQVEGLSLSRNFGKDVAVMAGLAYARGEAVVVMDGDGQHPSSLIPEMVAAWKDGADVVDTVKTSRPDQGWLLRVAARLFNRSFSALTGVNLTDATDFRLLSRPVVDELVSMPERAVFFRGLSTWLGFRRRTLAFEPRAREAGETRWTLRSLARYAVRNLVSYTSAPLHVVTAVGAAFAVFAVLLGAQTIFNWLAGQAVEGFTTVIVLLLIQGSVVMLALGVIGLYIAEIHKEVKGRPRYVVARRTSGLP